MTVASHTALIPQAECYWAVLELAGGKPGHTECAYAFEAVLPVPVEELQVVFVRLAGAATGQAMLAIGVDREHLRQIIGEHGSQPWCARPDSLPDHVAERVPTELLDKINMLSGTFEPPPKRRLRMAAVAVFCVGVVASAAVLVGSAQKKVAQYEGERDVLRNKGSALALAAAPAEGPGDTLLPANRLTRDLRLARMAARNQGPQTDLLPVLQTLWRQWPPAIRVQINHVGLSETRLIVHGRAPDAEAAARLAETVGDLAVPGMQPWVAAPLDLPRVDGESAHFALTFAPAGAGGAP